MTLTIELTTEEEARIRQEAAACGLDTQEYAHRKLLEVGGNGARPTLGAKIKADPRFPKARYVNLTPEEKVAAFLEWSNRAAVDVALSDETFDRESIYRDRG